MMPSARKAPGRRRDARDEVRPLDLGGQGDALVEVAFGRHEALGDAVELVEARASSDP